MLPELVFARGLKAWRVEWMMGCDFSRNLRSLFPMHPLMSLGIQDLVFALPSGPSNTERGTAGLLRHPPRNWSLINLDHCYESLLNEHLSHRTELKPL